ncbi:hypothetical protein ACSFB8_11040 [Enterococcus faecalis]|jgi:hypothetical protein
MCQKLQTYLKENKINLMLKYDSPRKENQYTLLFFDLEHNEILYGGDISSIENRLNDLSILDKNIPIIEIKKSLYRLFKMVENHIKNRDEVILILSTNYLINEETLNYTFSITSPKKSERVAFNSYTELEAFIEKNYE